MDDPLAALRPLHAPPPIPGWPPAPGWWLLLLLILVLVLLVLWWRKRAAPQRAALRELKSLERRARISHHPSGSEKCGLGDSPVQQAAALNRLLKRYALACWPGTEAASLTGEAWLAFLDTHGGDGGFLRGPGRALLTLPYGNGVAASDDLLSLARRWIKANRPGRQG